MTTNVGYGPIINDTQGRATTIRQIGGVGTAWWKQLVYGAHLPGAWNTVEHVTLTPGATIGEHRHDRTEEIYYIISGRATMTMDGESLPVQAGDLITTPIGTRHMIANAGDDDMVFYVTEVYPGSGPAKKWRHISMPAGLEPVTGFLDSPGEVKVSQVQLTDMFTGPWRVFSELHLLPGAQLGEYSLDGHTEVLFVVSGRAAVTLEGETYDGGPGMCVAMPSGVRRRIDNTSTDAELRLISTEVHAE